MENKVIVLLSRKFVKFLCVAVFIFFIAALGELKLPQTVAAVLAENALLGVYFKLSAKEAQDEIAD